MNQKIKVLFDKLTHYSPIFYVVMIVMLIGVATNFFNQKFLTDNIIEIVILLNLIPLTSFAITKATGGKLKNDPALECPDCSEKMKPLGNWKCSNCDGIFKHGKKGNLKSGT